MDERLPKTWDAFLSQQNFLPVIVKSIERIHDATWSMVPNMHNHFEVVYMKKGSSIFRIGDDDVRLEPHDMIIIKPNNKHQFIVKSEVNCEFIVLSFLFEDTKSKSISNVPINDFIEFVNEDNTGGYVHFKLTKKNDISLVLEKIMREREHDFSWDTLMTHLLLMELFVLISRTLKNEWEQNSKSRYAKIKELLSTAKAYMESNYNHDITLSDVAKYVFLSDSYFAHSFKAEFGISPKNYILKLRIDASKELLVNTDMRICDVSLSVGFASQQRYNDIFKKFEGTTPLKYKKNMKIQKLNVE